ncbi:MAG: FAD-binding and (Fe-S)-binding domain-containing protein [Candidatus Methylomirabilales bacterium]
MPDVGPAQLQAIAADLRNLVEGDARFDEVTRVLYSTGACMYRIKPLGVVFPKHREDVILTVRYAADRGIPLIPRGGGSSRCGQELGAGIVLDFTRYMHRILELDPGNSRVRVEPGCTLTSLTRALKPHDKYFPPDPSSGDVCALGGMLATNSKGAHSVKYGTTRDYLASLDVVLASGDLIRTEPVDRNSARLQALLRDRVQGPIYQGLLSILEGFGDQLKEKAPEVTNNNCGYNLWRLAQNGIMDLGQLFTGSEGTLGIFTEATFRVLDHPRNWTIALLSFDSLEKMGEAVVVLREHRPSMVEILERQLLDLSRREAPELRPFLPEGIEAILILEHEGEHPEEVETRMAATRRQLVEERRLATGMLLATSPDDQAKIVAVRKVAGGVIGKMKGPRKALAFIEDAAVHPTRLPDFIGRMRQLLKRYDVTAGVYGHAGDGNLHILPLLDPKDARDIAMIRAMAEEAHGIVWDLKGTISAEHGDGLARTCYIGGQYGGLEKAFREVKVLLDPHGMLNPGKIVSDDPPQVNGQLRYGSGYRTAAVGTHHSFREAGGFAAAVERCTGVGNCRKVEGTMCPSYMVTREEEHCTRGRANLLRAALSGELPPEALSGPGLYGALDLCLDCKACKRECPTGVDMAKLKAEFLARYYERNGVPLRVRLFAHAATLGRWGSRLAPLSNWATALPGTRWLLHHLVGIEKRRPLPPFASVSFPGWFQRRGGSPPGAKGQVALFPDTFMTYHYPEVGIAVTRLLEGLGYQVILADVGCCGRTFISKGLLGEAVGQARATADRLSRFVEARIPIVGCEPSCLLTLRDEYRDLLEAPVAEAVGRQGFLLEEFLLERHGQDELRKAFRPIEGRVLLHAHCHQKALVGARPTIELLRLIPGLSVEEVDAGCCGMAGSFGFEREHYDLSVAIGRQRLFPAIEKAGTQVEIVASGVSCRQQILHGTGRWAKHPAQVLAEAIV